MHDVLDLAERSFWTEEFIEALEKRIIAGDCNGAPRQLQIIFDVFMRKNVPMDYQIRIQEYITKQLE